MTARVQSIATLAAVAILAGTAQPMAAERLGALPIDPGAVTVAGFSSGAFMANQIHVAHSAGVMGAALVAGGLYGVAVERAEGGGVAGSAALATLRCMTPPLGLGAVAGYKAIVEGFAARGLIDPPANLAHAKVYLFSGGSDAFVGAATVGVARDLYLAFGARAANVTFVDRSGAAARAGHAWVTETFGGPCAANAPPFVNACGYDQAGAELAALYGPRLAPPAGAPGGRIVPFDQTEFAPGRDAAANGLSDTGFLYAPRACEPGGREKCRLQVVLHGCTQSAETTGDGFYAHAGINRWADANRIVVLYPQAHATNLSDAAAQFARRGPSDLNPMGCWNWWGYAGDRLYLTKKGVQVEAIWRMIERLEGR